MRKQQYWLPVETDNPETTRSCHGDPPRPLFVGCHGNQAVTLGQRSLTRKDVLQQKDTLACF